MELKIDLLEKGKKSTFKIVIGILFLAIASERILGRVFFGEVVSLFGSNGISGWKSYLCKKKDA
jgi:hypothetical protein